MRTVRRWYRAVLAAAILLALLVILTRHGALQASVLISAAIGSLPLAVSFAMSNILQGAIAAAYLKERGGFALGDFIVSGWYAGTVEHFTIHDIVLRLDDGRLTHAPALNVMTQGYTVGRPPPIPAAAGP